LKNNHTSNFMKTFFFMFMVPCIASLY